METQRHPFASMTSNPIVSSTKPDDPDLEKGKREFGRELTNGTVTCHSLQTSAKKPENQNPEPKEAGPNKVVSEFDL